MCVNLCVEAGYWNIKGSVPLRDAFLPQRLTLLAFVSVPA